VREPHPNVLVRAEVYWGK